jgi:GntR family transcriptional repressor for pyruvate dehydrogenase complex
MLLQAGFAMEKIPVVHVKRERVSDQVAEQLHELIRQGVLKPKQKIPGEIELAARFSTSRASIREALRTLETMGLVEIKNGSGAYVANSPFSSESLSDNLKWLIDRREMVLKLLDVREVLQGLAAKLCAENVTQEQLSLLEEYYHAMQQATAAFDPDDLSDADTRFHYLIGESCGNEILDGLIKRLEESYRSSSRALMDLRGRSVDTVRQHKAVLEAIQNHDGVLAEKEMRFHIASVRKDIEALGVETNPPRRN